MVALTALVVTFLLAVLFYGVTAHIAARYVLGSVPISRAFLVGLVPAVISFALQAYQSSLGVALIIVLALSADFFAIRAVYRIKYRTTALVAIAHYTISVLFGITILNLVRLLGTAPT
ncbi:DUF7473 family protein [Halorussus halophilus]|uniref:DUF7473 family protein n=1 Tax=Halorussus halophilus TaxID=2650975 RepID=UPI0013017CF1|nr:hypothetical protein [Halorussus halophilus]